MHVIDYGHSVGPVLYHGTISTLDGRPRATWTFERHGRKVTEETPIDKAAFQKLWNAVVELDVFRRNKVRDRSRQIDPASYHVVGIVYGEKNQPKKQVFLVPKDEHDPQFLEWLAELNIPKGSGPPSFGDAGELGSPACSQAGSTRGISEDSARQSSSPSSSTDADELELVPESDDDENADETPLKAASPNAAAREAVYPAMFGQQWAVVTEPAEEGPPIDVYLFAPSEERPFFTLVTGGMSDARMNLPPGVPFRRAELALYLDDPTDECILLLQWLAQLPLVQEQTWYAPGTTMTNGNPPQPIFAGSPLDCYLFLFPIVAGDNKLHERLQIQGDPTALLWTIPITQSERRFMMDRDLNAFLDVLEKNQHPFVLDPQRKGYV